MRTRYCANACNSVCVCVDVLEKKNGDEELCIIRCKGTHDDTGVRSFGSQKLTSVAVINAPKVNNSNTVKFN